MPSLETIIAIIATIGICFGLHSLDILYLNHKNTNALSDQKNTDIKDCNTKIAITAGVDHDLQNNINAINGRLTASSVPNATCVPVFAWSTTSNNDTSGRKPARSNGLSSKWLKQYAATAEIYRAKVISCQEFLTEERTTP